MSLLELRAEGATLEGSGSSLNVTRERVRQIENKYLERFETFYLDESNNIQNHIRAFVANEMFISDQDIAQLFPANSKIFKYLLKLIESEDLLFIDEIDKFCFAEDAEWYDELLSFSEQLPTQIAMDEAENFVPEALSILKKKNVELSADDCRAILFQNHKKVGIFYSRKKLSLKERFKTILKTYYSDPVNIYSAEFLADFKKHNMEMFGEDDLKSDHAITSILSRIAVLVSRGEYVLSDQKLMSKELADKIFDYLNESENTIFLTNTIFHFFKEELISEKIDNKYFMSSAFKQWYGDKFFFKRDYISKSKFSTNIYDEVVNFIKKQGRIVLYEEVVQNFPATSWTVLNFAFANDDILNYRAKYIHIDNLHVEDEDVEFLREVTRQTVCDGKIHHMQDLLNCIRLERPQLLDKYFLQDQFSLYSFLEHFFDEDFELKRPFVAQNGIQIENQYDRIKAFVCSQEETSISSLLEFTSNNKLHMNSIVEFVDSLENHCFKDEVTIVEIEKTGVNKENINELEQLILKELGENDFVFADKLKFEFSFPKGVCWTPWLIYSGLNKFGNELKAIASNTKFRVKGVQYARPLIIRKSNSSKDINEFKENLKNKMILSDSEFEKFLVENQLV